MSGPSNNGAKDGFNGTSRRPSRRLSSRVDRQEVLRDLERPKTPGSSVAIPATSGNTIATNPGSTQPASASSVGGSPVSASVRSNRSLDIDNPDPKLVQKVGRHLVPEEQGFDSLQLQSGDITREIYNWQREHRTSEGQVKRGRSKSFDIQCEGHPDLGLARDMLVPGGFRREFVATHGDSESVFSGTHPSLSRRESTAAASSANVSLAGPVEQHHVFTRNFIEFLSLYGHFAGEELEEDEDEDGDEDEDAEGSGSGERGAGRRGGDGPNETTSLLRHPRRPRIQRRQSHQQAKGQASTVETVMLLLKSFVGTGVLFLPRAFYNGGLLFSSSVLIFVSAISYWCFLLLIATKEHTKVSSFGDIGGALYGHRTRKLVLGAIVVSQIGFASAYIVFVAENLRSFVTNVYAASTVLDDGGSGAMLSISTLIVVQLVFFLPLSMIRDIAKLGFTALIADAFILAGLIYLYSWSGVQLMVNGIADVAMFNSSNWTLFIGTAVFTYEGVGLIIPIQESMREPKKFGTVLGGVMVAITLVFVSVGALLYAACGSQVETVILLNLPHGQLTNTIQLLYSLAILLSTPLQLFPAIRILENALFVRSGKFSRTVKWQKNVFRFLLVFFTGIVAYCGADDLDKFVALIGSVACVPLVYIFPPLFHLQIVAPYSFAYLADVALAMFGAGIMAYTSLTTAMSWISG